MHPWEQSTVHITTFTAGKVLEDGKEYNTVLKTQQCENILQISKTSNSIQCLLLLIAIWGSTHE